MVDRDPRLARRFFDRFEPVHATTYFAPEARTALDGMGFTGFWRGYFAARCAPLGRPSAEVVTAVFYNFSAQRVNKALPAVWEVANPADVLQVRQASAVTTLRRYGLTDDVPDVAEAAELAGAAARSAPQHGRPLFAANLALPAQALSPTPATLLRLKDHVEHRTDALALTALQGLDDAGVERLFQALTPLTRRVIAGGDIPAATPMGLRRNELDDGSAHL